MSFNLKSADHGTLNTRHGYWSSCQARPGDKGEVGLTGLSPELTPMAGINRGNLLKSSVAENLDDLPC